MGTRLTPEEKRARERERRQARQRERQMMEMDRANIQARDRTAKPMPEPGEPGIGEVIGKARDLGREADLWYRVHMARYSHRPREWTREQKEALLKFLQTFIRPDGTPQPVPNHRRKAK